MKSDKLLGQHFLRDCQALAKIIKAADLSEKNTVLEVGPGHGELTFELAKKAGRILAVEKDKSLIAGLEKRFNKNKNVKIIEGDILKLINLLTKKLKNYKLIANIPYYLTSRLIKNFLEAKHPPKVMVLMLQKEVAQRICSQPPHMSLLAVSVQVYAEPKIISYVSKKSFWPQPKVDSAIIKIARIRHGLNTNRTRITRMKNFFKMVKAGFAAPRKKLSNNLSNKLALSKQKLSMVFGKCGFSQNTRAQELSVENWQQLAHMLLDKNIV